MNGLSRPSRRTFLGSLAAGIAFSPASLQAAGSRLPKLSFVVVSDTHLGYRDQGRAAEQWERTAAEIAKAPGELALHLGDVVDGGRESQYPVYLDIKRTIGKPVHEIPGNHDPQALFAKHVREQVDTVVDCQWLRFLLLNDARPDSHDGFLSEDQVQWIDRQCAGAAKEDRYLILCLHVPVHSNRAPDRGWHVKPEHGQTALYETLQRHRDRVLCLMHGHFHNGVRGWDDHAPLHEIVFPSALYNRDRRLEDQQAPGYNLPEFRPSFTLVSIENGQIRLRYQPVGDEASAGKNLALRQLGEA